MPIGVSEARVRCPEHEEARREYNEMLWELGNVQAALPTNHPVPPVDRAVLEVFARLKAYDADCYRAFLLVAAGNTPVWMEWYMDRTVEQLKELIRSGRELTKHYLLMAVEAKREKRKTCDP